MKSQSSNPGAFKAIFIGINTIMGLIGAACFSFGIYMKFSSHEELEDLRSTNVVANLLISGGFFSVLLSVLGCVGAALQKTYLLVPYFFIALLMFVLLIVICVFGFKQVRASSEQEAGYIQSVNVYHKDPQAKAYVDRTHSERKCCGIKHPKVEFNGTIPTSCDQHSEVYRSCVYGSTVRDYFATAGGVAIGFAVVIMLCMIGVIFLYSAIKNRGI